jgi:carbonic anhydrase/acetyltransferase-like protein (isoleucine patch superfamily)
MILLLFDLISLVFFVIQMGLFFFPPMYLWSYFGPTMSLMGLVVLTPLTVFLGMVFVITFLAIATRINGEIKPGYHRFPKSKTAFRWSILFSIKKFTTFGATSQFIYSFAILRAYYLWASKSKSSFNFMHANLISLQDLSFIRIGKNSMFGIGSMLAPHQIVGDILVLKNIVVGDRVQFHGQTVILGGCSIGNDTIIGPGTGISLDCKIGKNVKVRLKCYLAPKVVIEDNCIIGDNSILSKGCKVLEGVMIPANSYIPESAIVTTENAKTFLKYRELDDN